MSAEYQAGVSVTEDAAFTNRPLNNPTPFSTSLPVAVVKVEVRAEENVSMKQEGWT
jgi:hypothetical protein